MWRCARRRATAALAALIVLAATGAGAAPLAPIDATGADAAVLLGGPRRLILAVTVNGVAAERSQPFTWTPPGRLAAEPRVLRAIGIAVAEGAAPDTPVDLSTLPDVTVRFDEADQAIAFTLPDSRRQPRVFDARRAPPAAALAPVADWGAFANYSLFGGEVRSRGGGFRFSGANLTLDTRVFSPYGVMQSGTVVGTTLGRQREGVRLDTSYTVDDPTRLLTGRLGDTIGGGLGWTRPLRLGGVQVQRDFGLQPGLVTQPLPSFAGSAAVPSTVDVFVGASKIYSTGVEPGPFELTNLPSLSNGRGDVVVTDATGRQTRESLPLYAVGTLLQPGLSDFSAEAGFARRSFGLLSDDYDPRPIASVTGRLGLLPLVTAEAHLEGGAGLVNGGGGAVVGTPWGTLEGAVSLSWHAQGAGAQLFAAFDTQLGPGVILHAGAQWRTDCFDDLAGVTARQRGTVLDDVAFATVAGLGALGLEPPKSLAQLSVTAPVPFGPGTVSASLIERQDGWGAQDLILSGSFSRPLPFGTSLFSTAFTNLARRGGGGLLVGLTVALGADITATAGLSGGAGGTGPGVSAQKALGTEAGSYGWEVAGTGGLDGSHVAAAAYRGGFGTAAATVSQGRGAVGGTASLDGAVALMGGSVAAGNRVRDGFALVDAGLPGVAVLQDNRPIGTTDPWGHLLLSDLSPAQPSRIALDPLSVPAGSEVASNDTTVVPVRAGGVRVAFGGERDVHGLLLVLVDKAGRPLPAGSTGRLDRSGDAFVVGYDGLAYLRRLQDHDTATLDTPAGTCHVDLDAAAPARPDSRRSAACL